MTIALNQNNLADAIQVAGITGDQLVYVADSSNIEARMLAWLAGQDNLLEIFRSGGDVYANFASILFGRPIDKEVDKLERFIGKVCIAEGSLVLTDAGLVPIEKVTLDHKVWDGVNWVRHDGVVYQGYKKVITYAGLTATPDHRVYTQGRSDPIQIGDAASSLDRLVRSEFDGQAVRVGDHYLPAHRAAQRIPTCADTMHGLRSRESDQPGQPQIREDLWVPNLLAEAIELVHRAWETLRCLDRALQFAAQSSLSTLRGTRDHLQLCLQGGVHTLRRAALAAPGLPGHGNRPRGQQWELRTGEPTPSDARNKLPQPRSVDADQLAGQTNTPGRVPVALRLHADAPLCKAGANGRADNRAGAPVSSGETQGLEGTASQAHVYDILNAGPNRRFTVGGVLVANCVLGLGYGMGWRKFRDTLAAGALGGEPVYFTEIEAQNAVNTYRAANSMITTYWKQADNAIVDMYLGNTRQWGPLTIHKNCLVMPNGMALQYSGLRPIEPSEDGTTSDGWEYWNGKFWTKIYGGKLVENITQALSRIVLFEQMVNIDDAFDEVGGRVALNVHDEVIAVGPSFGAVWLRKEGKKDIWHNAEGAEALFERMLNLMRTPEPWCLDLPLDSEGGFALEYSK